MAWNNGYNYCCTSDWECSGDEFCQQGPGCEPPEWWSSWEDHTEGDSLTIGDWTFYARGGTCIPIPYHAILQFRWPNALIPTTDSVDMHPGGVSDPNDDAFWGPYADGYANYLDMCYGTAGVNACKNNIRMNSLPGEDAERKYPSSFDAWINNKKIQDYWIGVNENCHDPSRDYMSNDCDLYEVHQYFEIGVLGWHGQYSYADDWRDTIMLGDVSNGIKDGGMDSNGWRVGHGFPFPSSTFASNGGDCSWDAQHMGEEDIIHDYRLYYFPKLFMPMIEHDDGDIRPMNGCLEIFPNMGHINTGRNADGSPHEYYWDGYLWGEYLPSHDMGQEAGKYTAYALMAGRQGGMADNYFGNYQSESGDWDYGPSDWYAPGHCVWGDVDEGYGDKGWRIFPQWGYFAALDDEGEESISEKYINELTAPTYAGKWCYMGFMNDETQLGHNSGKYGYFEVRVGNGWKYIIEFLGQIPGCTDPIANNYNPNATVEDGSCDYAGSNDDGSFDTGNTGNIEVCPDLSAMNFGASGGGAYSGWEGTDQSTDVCQWMTCLHPLAKNFLQAQGGVQDGPRFLSLNIIRQIFQDESLENIHQGMCYFDFTDDPIGFIDVHNLWTDYNSSHHLYGGWDKTWQNKWQLDNAPGSGWPYLYMEGQTYYSQMSDETNVEVSYYDNGKGVLSDGLWGGSLYMWDGFGTSESPATNYAAYAQSAGGGPIDLSNGGWNVSQRELIEYGNLTVSNPDQGVRFNAHGNGSLYSHQHKLNGLTTYGPHSISPMPLVGTGGNMQGSTNPEFKYAGYMHEWYFNNTADQLNFNESLAAINFSYSGFSLNFKSDWFSQIGRYLHGDNALEWIYGGGSKPYYNQAWHSQGAPTIPLGSQLSDHLRDFNMLGNFEYVKNQVINPTQQEYVPDEWGAGVLRFNVEEVWLNKGLKIHPCANYDAFLNCKIYWQSGEYNVAGEDSELGLVDGSETVMRGAGLTSEELDYCTDTTGTTSPTENNGLSSWSPGYDSRIVHGNQSFAWVDFKALDEYLHMVADKGGDNWENYRPQAESGFRYKLGSEAHHNYLEYGNLCEATAHRYEDLEGSEWFSWGNSGHGCLNNESKVEIGWSPLFRPGSFIPENEDSNLNDDGSKPYDGAPEWASLQFNYRFNPQQLFSRELFCNPYNEFVTEGFDLMTVEPSRDYDNLEVLYHPEATWGDYLRAVYDRNSSKNSIDKYHEVTEYLDINHYKNWYKEVFENEYDFAPDTNSQPSGHPTGLFNGIRFEVSVEFHNPNLLDVHMLQNELSEYADELSGNTSIQTGLLTGGTTGLFQMGNPVNDPPIFPNSVLQDGDGSPLYTSVMHLTKKMVPLNITLVNNHPDFGCNSFDFEETVYQDIMLSIFEPYDEITYDYIAGYKCADGSFCNQYLLYENDEESILASEDSPDFDEVNNDGRFVGSTKTYSFNSPWPTDFSIIPQLKIIAEDSECSEGGFRVYLNDEELTGNIATTVGEGIVPTNDGRGLCQGYDTEPNQHNPFVYTSGFMFWDNHTNDFRRFDEANILQQGVNELKIEANSSIVIKSVEVALTDNIYGDIQPVVLCEDNSRCGVKSSGVVYQCPMSWHGQDPIFFSVEECHAHTSCNNFNVPCRTIDGFAESNAVDGWGLITDSTLSSYIWGHGDDWINRCWAAGHCNNGYDESSNFTLTKAGLTSYEYKISTDVEQSQNILAPLERISNVVTTTPSSIFDEMVSDLMEVKTSVNLDLNVSQEDAIGNSIVDLTGNHSNFIFNNDNEDMINQMGQWAEGSHLGSSEHSLNFVPLGFNLNNQDYGYNQSIGGTTILGTPEYGQETFRKSITFDYWINNNDIAEFGEDIQPDFESSWWPPINEPQYHFSLFQNDTTEKRPIFALGTLPGGNLILWDRWGETTDVKSGFIPLINQTTGDSVNIGTGYYNQFVNLRIIFNPTANATTYKIYKNNTLQLEGVLNYQFPQDTRWMLGGVPLSVSDIEYVNMFLDSNIKSKENFCGKISGFSQLVHQFSDKDYILQGFRDEENKCCEATDFNCIESLQTRFNVNNFYKASNNLFTSTDSLYGTNHAAHGDMEFLSEGGGITTPFTLIGESGLALIRGKEEQSGNSYGIRFGYELKVGDFFSAGDTMEETVLKKNTQYTISTYVYVPEDLPLNDMVQWCLDGDEDHEPPGGWPGNCGELGWTGDGETNSFVLQSPIKTDWNRFYCEDEFGTEVCAYDTNTKTSTCTQADEGNCVLGPGIRIDKTSVRVGAYGGDYMFDIPTEEYPTDGNPNLSQWGILDSYKLVNDIPGKFTPTYRGRWQRISTTFKTSDQFSHGEHIHIVWSMNGAGGGFLNQIGGGDNPQQYFYTFGAQIEEGDQLGFYNPISDLGNFNIDIPQGYYLTFLDMNVLNSPLQVCEGDVWLENPDRGFGSSAYDVTIKNQPSVPGDPTMKHITTQLLPEELIEYNGYNKPAKYYVDDLYRTDTELVFKITRDFTDWDWTYSLPPSRNSSPIPISIRGANVPKLQSLRIVDVSVFPQIGVQLRDSEPQIIEYNNRGDLLIENGEFNVGYTSITYPDPTIDDVSGVKSVGYIDFSTFELAQDSPPIHIKVDDRRISNDFETQLALSENYTLPVWEQLVQAINEYANPTTGLQEYRAYYDPSSDTNPDSNLKKIIIEANYVGEEYNGELSWTLQEEYTVLGGLGYRQPRFISLQNGKKYPIIHLYEDFGALKLDITASDVDAGANIFFQAASDKPEHFRTAITNYSMVSNPIGDTSNIGGNDEPNLTTDSPVEGAGESIAYATLSIETYGGGSEMFSSLNPSVSPEQWELVDPLNSDSGVELEYVDTWEFIMSENAMGLGPNPGETIVNDGPHFIKHPITADVGEYYRYSFSIKKQDRSVIMVCLGDVMHQELGGYYSWSGQRGGEATFNLDSLTVTERLQIDPETGEPIPSLNSYVIKEIEDGYIYIEGTVLADGNQLGFAGEEPKLPGETFNSHFYIFLGLESAATDDYGIQSTTNGVPIYTAEYGVQGVQIKNLSYTNNEYEANLTPNYVGDTRIVLRTMDETTMTDLTEFVIRTHPVNDPPLIEAASDTEVYLNNPKYQTDINIELETQDVENIDGTRQLDLLSFDLINESYCDKIYNTIELFQDTYVSYNDEIYPCTDLRFCTTLCNEPLGKTKQETEMSCSFANFLGRNIISPADYLACEDIRVDTDNDRDGDELFYQNIEFKSGDNLPNFLNPNKVDEFKSVLEYEDDDVTTQRIKKYIHIEPRTNITGSFVARVGVRDDGINEDGELTQIRTGYSTVKVDVAGVDTGGPTGKIFSLETAAFGITPDTFEYYAKGDDIRPTIPTYITKDFDFVIYEYERENEKVISYCDIMPNTFINEVGECCKSIPIQQNYKDYFNHNKVYWYQQEYRDEIELLFNYFKKDTPGTKWCHAAIDSVAWNYGGSKESNNIGGYFTPNVEVNELDHVVSYKLEVVDLIENYYSIPEDAYWWNELWEDDWLNTWSRLRDEGWDTEGDNFYFDKKLFQAGPFTHEANNMTKIIDEGFVYRFDYPSIFKVSVYAEDTYGFVGESFEIIDARDVIKLNQTLEGRYNPWQGWNILGHANNSTELKNSEFEIDERDKDKRPSLGLWYYDELIANKQKDWYVLHTDSFKNLEGNFTGSFSTKYNTELEKVESNNNIGYYPGKVYNELAFSNNFNNAKGKVTEEQYNQNSNLMQSYDFTSYESFLQSEFVSDSLGEYIEPYDKTYQNSRTGLWVEGNKLLDTKGIIATEFNEPNQIVPSYWRLKKPKFSSLISDKSFCTMDDNERSSQNFDDILGPYEYLEPIHFTTYDVDTLGLKTLYANIDDCNNHCQVRDKHLRDNGYEENDNWREVLNLGPLDYPYAENPCIKQDWERLWNVYYWAYFDFFSNLNLFPNFWSDANHWYNSYWYSYYISYDCLLNGTTTYRILDNSNHSLFQILSGNLSYIGQIVSEARQECLDTCFIRYNSSKEDESYCKSPAEISEIGGTDATELSDWTLNHLLTNNNFSTLSQTVIFTDSQKQTTDRIFSTFMRKSSISGANVYNELATLIVEKIKSDGSIETHKKYISNGGTNGDWSNMMVMNNGAILNLEDENLYPLGSNYGDNWHPDYPFVVPMWSYYPIEEGWNRFLMRIQFDETDLGYKFKIMPGYDGDQGVVDVMNWDQYIDIANTQVETVEPYKELVQPVQETFLPGLVKPYDFIPDADVRSPMSLGGAKSVMYKYYDDDLQPDAYKETTAPVKAQIFFYIRDPYERDIFAPKQIIEYPNNSLYIAFLDWGDGSKIEYDKEPLELKDSKTIDHIYEDSGVYEIRGEMFNIARDTEGEVLGIGTFKEFVLRINISTDYEIENEFKQLGGAGYSFIPYKDTVPIISGISNKSYYFKKIKRTLGYIDNSDGTTIKVKTRFKSWTDEMKTELALAHIDDNIIGPKLSAMTGSIASESNLVDEDELISVSNQGAYCYPEDQGGSEPVYVCNMLGSPNDGLGYLSYDSCADACQMFLDADRVRGFYDGVVDAETGEIVGDNKNYRNYDGTIFYNTVKPRLINKGSGTNFAELGEWLGNTDFGQLRYFDRPIDMWEFLGVDGTEQNHPNNPGSLLYWNNIIPKNTHIGDREGVSKEKEVVLNDEVGHMIQFYGIGDEGLSYDVMFENWEEYVSNGWVTPVYSWVWPDYAQQGAWQQLPDFDDSVDTLIYSGNDVCDFSIGDTEWVWNHCFGDSQGDAQVNRFYYFEVLADGVGKFSFTNDSYRMWKCYPGGTIEECEYLMQMGDYDAYEECRRDKCFDGISPEVDYVSSDKVTDIDESASQIWKQKNKFGYNYYYPVLPKLNKLGNFEEEGLGLQSNIDKSISGGFHINDILNPIYFDTPIVGMELTNSPDTNLYDSNKIVAQYTNEDGWTWTQNIENENEPFGETFTGIIYENQQWYLYCGDNSCVDEDTLQNIYYNNYVGKIIIDKIDNNDAYAPFILQSPSIYGQRQNWDDDDKLSSVTLDVVPAEYAGNSILDLDVSAIEDKSIVNKGVENSLGVTFEDYLVKFDEKDGKPTKQKPKPDLKIGKDKKRGQF